MALPVVVPVGEDTANRLREKLIPAIHALRIGVANDPDADYGPVVTPEHKARIEQWITVAEEEGGEIVIDGRGFTLQGHEKGFFVGPTLIDHVTPQMTSYQEEIFGPVLQIVRAKDFEEAVRLPTKHQYGNGVAIFTRDGDAARELCLPRSMSAWSASTCRSRCRSPTIPSAGGSVRALATLTSTAPRA